MALRFPPALAVPVAAVVGAAQSPVAVEVVGEEEAPPGARAVAPARQRPPSARAIRTRSADPPADRADIDNFPGALRAHHRKDGIGHLNHAEEVRFKQLPYLVNACLLAGTRRANQPGIVDQHINPAGLAQHGLDTCLDRCGRMQIQRQQRIFVHDIVLVRTAAGAEYPVTAFRE